MARDLYMRDPTDPNFKSGILEVSDEIEMLISQIKMILLTNKGEVLGAPDFGLNLEEQLFTLNRNEYTIRGMIQDQVMSFCELANKYRVTFDVKFARGNVRDMCLINVVIDGTKAFGVLVN